MLVSFNPMVSSNRQQKQSFGSYSTAKITSDSLWIDLQAKKIDLEQAKKKIEEEMQKEDAVGKKFLKAFKEHLTGKKE